MGTYWISIGSTNELYSISILEILSCFIIQVWRGTIKDTVGVIIVGVDDGGGDGRVSECWSSRLQGESTRHKCKRGDNRTYSAGGEDTGEDGTARGFGGQHCCLTYSSIF
jgi:hypothetical protein